MDPAHVSRLKEEQERSLEETLASIKKWEKFDHDYTTLKERLQTLPDKISHSVMVPLGPVAFMPGQIVHTNEIMVLLGDNWFAERSAKQACEIIDRRKEHLKSMLSDLAKQRHLLESRLGFTAELKDMSENKGDLVDIREEYDPEKEAKWREERKKKKREAAASRRQTYPQGNNYPSPQEASSDETPSDHKKGPAEHSSILQSQLRSTGSKHSEVSGDGESERTRRNIEEQTDTIKAEDEWGMAKGRMTEEELWARLDELERQEEELDELALMSDGEIDPTDEVQPSDEAGKHVRWRDEQSSDNGEDNDSQARPATITFKHTQMAGANSKFASAASASPTEIPTAVKSPADIYNQYLSSSAQSPDGKMPTAETSLPQNQPLRSILKNGTSSHPANAADGGDGMQREETSHHVILPAPVSAFSGRVTERPDTAGKQDVGPINPPSTTETQTAPPKKMSRFKAARQQQR